ncbi:MAG TPA: UDP-N-acetylmuramoyl-L-alanine--D-glutamate ligase [Armatimonadota bacterium]|jgi:UDP-N-acetylmuramoylalanine--D-glutamate ligase
MTFTGKRIAVIGAARTGVAVAQALVPRGASVCVLDGKPEAELALAAAALSAAGATSVWGRDDGPEVAAADIVVPSPGVPKHAPVLRGAVERGQTVWSEPEVAWRISAAPIIGITGTNGKTTTTALLGRMLADAGLDARVGGNIAPGRPLIDLAADAPADAFLIAELSSFQLEWIDGFTPLIGIITNITEDHLNRHKTMAEYTAMKARLFENQTLAEHAIVNADNPLALDVGRSSKGTLWTFSRTTAVERGAFMRSGDMVFRDGETETEIVHASKIRIPGSHNRENAMAAAIAARIVGVPVDSLARTLRDFAGVEHRMEVVAEIDGVTYVNNSMCTNPAALASSLSAFWRPVVLIAGGAEKGLDFAPVPPMMAAWCRAVFTIGDFGPDLAAMAETAGVEPVRHSGDLASALAEAVKVAQAGDVVMLAPGCASFDQFADFEDRGNQFKALVKAQAAK